MSATDDYKIALNILSKLGINHPDFMKEYAKAKNMLHQFDSFNAVQQHKNAHKAPVQPLGGTISPTMGQNTPQEPLGATNTPNTPSIPQAQPQGGQGTLDLPQ